MPKDFDNCVKRGGRVRRISGPNKQFGLEKGEYLDICFMNGEMYRGEVKKKESKQESAAG